MHACDAVVHSERGDRATMYSRLRLNRAASEQHRGRSRIDVRAATLGLLVTILMIVGVPAATACATSSTASPTAQTTMNETSGIFVDATRQGTLAQPAVPTVLRSRFVEVDFGRLRGGPEGPPGKLTLNLFDDAVLTATVSRVEPAGSGSGFVWAGTIPAAASGEVTLVVGDGIVTGNVRADGATYQIRFAGDGVHVVQQVDAGAFPAD